jgi:hypothetical protein
MLSLTHQVAGYSQHRPTYTPEQINRLQRLKDTTIKHDRVEKALEFLEDVLANAHVGREAEIYKLFGPPGVSKTTTINLFRRKNPPFEKDISNGRRAVIHPVISIQIPSGAGRNALWYEILVALGRDVRSIPKTADPLRSTAKAALQLHEVSVLLIDEAQNLTFNRTDRAVVVANEVIRELANTNLCQIVLVGVEELEQLGRATHSPAIKVVESQVQRRIMNCLYMAPFDRANADDFCQFGAVLQRLEDIACADPKLSRLTDLLPEFFEATGGVTADMVKLVTAAAKRAYHDGRTFISRVDLIHAFAGREGGNRANPFGLPAYARNASKMPEMDEKTGLWARPASKTSRFDK